ncbi:MAG: hypothetical protein Tsb009_36310 [Planctomycetaceae bacterium]
MRWNSLNAITFLILTGTVLAGLETNPLYAKDILWITNLKEAAQQSSQTQKPMILKFSASWCGYCRKMTKDTFNDPAVAAHINGCFIPVAVDADKHKELVKAVGVKGLPTTVIISPDLTILKRITGYKTATEFQKYLGKPCRQTNHETPLTAKPDPKIAKPVAQSRPTTPRKPTILFEQHCLVSMLDHHKVKIGNPKYTSTYQGKTVCFLNEDYKKRFDANPQKYWPVGDGFCQVTLQEQNRKVMGHPKSAVIYKQRLWFFVDKTHRQRFAKSPKRFFERLK